MTITDIPAAIPPFLAGAGWGDAAIEPLPGDASFRRYYRVRRGTHSALVMDAPPPHENAGAFIAVGRWLCDAGLRAPAILAEDRARGLVLVEDFGDERMRDRVDAHPAQERAVYEPAIDALVALHRCSPGPFAAYDWPIYRREAALFVEWYCPLMGIAADAVAYDAAWQQVLAPLIERQTPGVTVLRDYHAENIMLTDDGGQGLIDFQDALVGHPAYDLVSLLQDARRDVSEELEAAMLDRYRAAARPGPDFAADYARLGAQRNAKIVGIFARLWKRDGKGRYLAYIPRVWKALERDLAHPALAPVAEWFDANVPRNVRDDFGGELL